MGILGRDWTRWCRSNRPICQLQGYSASEIYLSYLEMLGVMDKHLGRQAAAA